MKGSTNRKICFEMANSVKIKFGKEVFLLCTDEAIVQTFNCPQRRNMLELSKWRENVSRMHRTGRCVSYPQRRNMFQ